MQSKSTANIYINGVAADATLKQLTAETRKLRAELALLSPTSQEFTEKAEKFKQVQKRIEEVNGELKQTKGFFGQLQAEIGKFGTLAIAYLGLDAITGKVGNMINKNAELSDSLADVQKTTGMTEAEVKKLNESFGQFDTRTARKELLELARDAGKLGITGKKEVEEFVRAADKINVALGEDLGKDAITQIGKLVSLFQLKEQFGLEQSMLKVASAMNTLGASSEASEGYITEFLNKMGGIAPIANISIDQVMALGATLDSLGQTVEVSSTALSKMFTKMASDASTYARIAGVSTEEFKKKMNDNALEAFMMVLEAAGKTEGGIVKLTETLGDLGIEGGRATGVFGVLAGNIPLLKEQMDIANKSFKEGTSVIDEFNVKNENLAAKLEKLQKWFGGLFVNNAFLEGLKQFVDYAVRLVNVPLSEKMENERIELRKIELQLLKTNLPQAERLKLYRELIRSYPEYFKNMEAETLTLDDVRKAIKAINDEMINKIILQKEDERIQANNEKAAQKKMAAMKAEDKLMEQMVKMADKYNLKMVEGLSTYQQGLGILSMIKDAGSPMLNYASGRQQLAIALTEYKKALRAANQQEELGTEMLKQREELMKRLGIKAEDTKAVDKAVEAGNESTDEAGDDKGGGDDPALPKGKSAYDVALEKLNQYFNVEKALIKNQHAEKIEDKAVYDAELLELEGRQLQARKDLLLKFKMDTSEIDLQLAEHNIKVSEENAKREAETKKLAFDAIKNALAEEEALIHQNYANGLLTEEQYQMQLQELKIGGLEVLKAAHQAYGDDVNAIEANIAKEKAKFEKQKQEAAQKTLKEEEWIAEQKKIAATNLKVIQQENLTDLIAASRGFFKENQAMARIALVASKAAAIAEIVIKAQIEKAAISAKWAGVPIPGAAAIALIQRQAVNSRMATSIAMIGAQTIQELNGFVEGGRTGRATTSMRDSKGLKIAGLVHEDEYVTPAWMMRDPVYANVTNWLEDKRVNKTPGYEAIKETSSTINNLMSPTDMSETNMLLKQVLTALSTKNDLNVVIGDDQLWEMRERLIKLEKAQDNARFS